MKFLLIGAGKIAREYVKALVHLGYTSIDVLSRREGPARDLADSVGGRGMGGGVDTLKSVAADYDAFIIAVPPELLMDYLVLLSKEEAPRILVEKPVALSGDELAAFLERFPESPARAALNRLYYPSVTSVRRHLAEDGGATSCQFSFCEWVHRIPPDLFGARTMARLGVANSIHVIATAFDVIGQPRDLSAQVAGAGAIDWHPDGAIYTGSGVSRAGVPFAYHADWLSAGRWSMAFRSRRGAYILEPIEGLSFCPRGSVRVEELMPPHDQPVKCGFVPMLNAWLNGEDDLRMALPAVLEHLRAVESIMQYPAEMEKAR